MCLSAVCTCAQTIEKSAGIIQNKIKFNLSNKECRFPCTTQNHIDMYLFYFLRIVIIKLELCMFHILSWQFLRTQAEPIKHKHAAAYLLNYISQVLKITRDLTKICTWIHILGLIFCIGISSSKYTLNSTTNSVKIRLFQDLTKIITLSFKCKLHDIRNKPNIFQL